MEDSEEDRGTVAYLEECAQQAGLSTQFLYVSEIGLTKAGRFVDLSETPIDVLFKLYPWEWMMREEFGKAIPGCGTQFIEPIWKSLLSNKGLLPYLWKMAPKHPNPGAGLISRMSRRQSWVRPMSRSRCSRARGANIRLFERGAGAGRQ